MSKKEYLAKNLLVLILTPFITGIAYGGEERPMTFTQGSAYKEMSTTTAHVKVFSDLTHNITATTPTPTRRPIQQAAVITSPPRSKKAEPTAVPIPTNNPATTAQQPSPTAIPPTLTPTTAQKNINLNSDVVFDMVNQHRQKLNLPPFEKKPEVCQISQSRTPELANEISGSGYMHQGFRARGFDFRITENMVSARSEQAAVSWWLRSGVHRRAIEGNKKYSCVSCHGRNCVQHFTDHDFSR